MKKLIFTALTSLAFVSAFAQLSNAPLVDRTNPIETQLKAIPSQKMLNNTNIFNKTGGLGQWFSNERRLINYGTQIDNTTGNPSIGTYRINYSFLANDSFVRYAYYDQQTSTQQFFNPYYFNIGYIFDGRSINYDAFPGTTSTLSNFTPYTIDSISIAYIYERFNPNPNIVDTLLFQIFYPTWTTNDTAQNSPFSDAWYPAPSTEAITTVDYNSATNLGTLKGGTQGNMRTIKIPLSLADSSLALPDGSINVRTRTFAITPIQNLQRRTRFAVTYKYIPSIAYAYGDTINGDTAAMRLVKKRNNSFRAGIISDYSAFSEGDNRVQPYVDRIHNLGLLARTEARYNQLATSNFFYGKYYSAGFTTTVGSLNLNIFPYMAVYVNNVTNAGVNQVQNSNLLSCAVFPNPATFNGTTSLVFNLKSTSKVSIDIYNLMGQQVKSITNKNFDGGENTVEMNLSGLNAGVYFVNTTVNGISQTKKLTIVQ